jgi:hypothetical protein
MTFDLARRAAVTLGAVLICWVGDYLLVPGLDLAVWLQSFRPESWIVFD